MNVRIFKMLLAAFIAVIPAMCLPSYAADITEIEQAIEKSVLLSNDIDSNAELAPFIPFDVFSDGVIQLIYARNMLEQNKLDTALFYARSSYVRFQTAITLAKARKMKFETLELERDYYKSRKPERLVGPDKKKTPPYGEDRRSDSPIDINPLIDAKLHRKDSAYRVQFSDKNLFQNKRFVLHNHGKNSLDKVIRVLKLYPKSQVKVVGHTDSYDYKGYSSKKAGVVADYLKKNNIASERITEYGMSNREVTDTYYGFRRVDRVELVITGIGSPR